MEGGILEMRGAPSIHTKEARVPTLLLLLRLCGSARFANKSRAYEREYDSEQRAKREGVINSRRL